jgi:hypothetical protein
MEDVRVAADLSGHDDPIGVDLRAAGSPQLGMGAASVTSVHRSFLLMAPRPPAQNGT